MAEKDTNDPERRVYTLPRDLVERLRAYQLSQGISSETEAARRLLDSALQMRDSVRDILRTLENKFLEDRDLRVLASEVLSKHVLVTALTFEPDAIEFTIANGAQGRMMKNGEQVSRDSDNDRWESVKRKTVPQAKSSAPPWEPASGDLDDEIPF